MSEPDKAALTVQKEELAAVPSKVATPASPPVPFHVEVLRAGQNLVRFNPGLALTLGYLFLTAVGMFYEWLFFNHFDLQIFNYAEPTDFLLVTGREPLLLLYTLLSLLVLIQFSRGHNRRLKKHTRYRRVYAWLSGKRWFAVVERILYIALVVGYFAGLTSTHAEAKAGRIHKGNGSRVRVEMVSDAAASKPGEKPGREYLLLGTTGKYLLLFDAANKRTEAVVVGNVTRITTVP